MIRKIVYVSITFFILLGIGLNHLCLAENASEIQTSVEPKDIENLKPKVDSLVSPVIDGGWCPGIVVGVIYKGKTQVWGYGKTVLKGDKTPDGDTEFETGSITKLFTQLLLLDMVQKGQMGLDDLAQEYLPSSVKLPTKDGKQITILDLVNHQSGLPHDPDDVDMNNPDPQSDYTVQQLYDYLSRVQLEFTPGENVGYSNTGVALLANIMSLKSGLSYEQYLSQRILNPIGLNDTGVYWTKTQESMVDPGYTTGGEPNPLWQWHQPTFVPVGAIHSTANDMLKLAKAVFTPESSTLSEIAFGKTAERIGWGPIIQHGGGTYGFISYFYVDRNKQTALIVWGNCANLMLLQLGLEVKKVLEGVPPQLIELPQLVSLSESELKPYLGKYRINKISHGWAMKIDSILELKLENGKLVSQSVDLKKANTTWCPEADGDFYIKQEAYHVTFIKDSTGKIVGMISKPNLMGINFSARKLDNSGNEY